MHIQSYLDRIDYHGPHEPTAATLRALHAAHLLAVPFENLNIGMGWPIDLDQAALFDKIVVRRRGGFCYELNGLFAALLSALGFEVTLLSAGVARQGGGFGPDFDHLTLLVTTTEEPRTTQRVPDQEPTGSEQPPVSGQSAISHLQSAMVWLADVGFGDSFRAPLRFDTPDEQVQDGCAYQIIAQDGEQFVLQRREGEDAWEAQYRFTLQPRRHTEFNQMCRYHQTSPDSSFTRRRICTRATPAGRITLSDMRLITTAAGQRQERGLVDEAEVRNVLWEQFGVDLAQPDKMTR